MMALVDCNNFYVSCERLFNPSLRGVPVVVLSNNDGNVIARSPEAKSKGVEFAIPSFQLRSLIEKGELKALSSNYALYGDMSRRVMDTVASFSPDVEVYSIDEAFVSLSGITENYEEMGRLLRHTVYRHTGIPVSVGIAPTKTLAKLANRHAKKNSGVHVILSETSRRQICDAMAVTDIWGVGEQYAAKLHSAGIYTASQFAEADPRWVQREMTIMGLRTATELRGIPCIAAEESPAPKKGITSSRSFGRPVTTYEEMREAVTRYTSRAAEKLRREGALAAVLAVYITTNRFRDEPQYSASLATELAVPSSHTPELIRIAQALLDRIFKDGFSYKKTSIIIPEIHHRHEAQLSLFHYSAKEREQQYRLMETVDSLNRRFGRNRVFFGTSGMKRDWDMRRRFLSPRYTTCWHELPVVR